MRSSISALVGPVARGPGVRRGAGAGRPVRFLVSGFFGLKIPALPPTSTPTSWALVTGTRADSQNESATSSNDKRIIEEAVIDPLLVCRVTIDSTTISWSIAWQKPFETC